LYTAFPIRFIDTRDDNKAFVNANFLEFNAGMGGGTGKEGFVGLGSKINVIKWTRQSI
jgi:hypothetical protein